jgi:hypothetical protein
MGGFGSLKKVNQNQRNIIFYYFKNFNQPIGSMKELVVTKSGYLNFIDLKKKFMNYKNQVLMDQRFQMLLESPLEPNRAIDLFS